MSEHAAVLRDSSGEIVATGSAATDAVVIAQAERQSLDRMQKRGEVETVERYAKQYEAAQRGGTDGF